MTTRLQKLLRRLNEAGATGVLLSSLSRRAREDLRKMYECRAARSEVVNRTERVFVDDRAAFDLFVQRNCPGGLDAVVPPGASRTEAAGLIGDAKAVKRCFCEGVFVRAGCAAATMTNLTTGVALDVGHLTRIAGGTAIVLDDRARWSCAGNVALIGNAEVFWQYELALPEAEFAIFTNGNMSERLLRWLASSEMAGCTFILWDDYDPVGASEYVRLCRACPKRASYYMPALVRELLPRGKKRLVTRQTKQLTRLREHLHDPVIRELVDLLDRHGRGLEQEVLLHRLTATKAVTA